jgi:hypothetical protein
MSDIPQISVTTLFPGDLGEILNACQKNLAPEEKERFIETLSGLTALQCEDLLALSLATRGELDCGHQSVHQTGCLKCILGTFTLMYFGIPSYTTEGSFS